MGLRLVVEARMGGWAASWMGVSLLGIIPSPVLPGSAWKTALGGGGLPITSRY